NLLILQPTQDNRAKFRIAAAHDRKDLQSIDAGHFQVKDQQPERFSVQQAERARARTAGADFRLAGQLAENVPAQLKPVCFIVQYQYFMRAFHSEGSTANAE